MEHSSRELFVRIYNEHSSNLSKAKVLTKNEKKADIIYHEQEFLQWLRLKYKNKLTEKTYPKIANLTNFKLYLKNYLIIKNRKEVRENRKELFDQVRLGQLKPISKHEYDIDIVDAFLKIEKLVNTVVLKSGYDKDHYIDAMKEPLIFYCENHDLPLQLIINSERPILISNNGHAFETHLGRTLIAFDVNKIEALLSYQNSKWTNKGSFPSLVEHLVYRYVLHNSPFDNNIRLEKIMHWVGMNRKFLKNPKNKSKTIEKDYGRKQKESSNFYYWPYSEESLISLNEALVKQNKIIQIDEFIENFKSYKDFPSKPIVWKASQIQLLYLLHLIYKGQKQHNSSLLHDIAFKLFTRKNGDLDQKVLNTTYNQLRADLNSKKNLSTGLLSIRSIFDSLHLS